MLTNDQVLLLLHLLLFLPLLVLVVLHTHMTLPQSPSHRHIRTYWQEIIVLRWCPCRSWPFPPSSTPIHCCPPPWCPPPWCPPPSCCPPTSPPSCPPPPWITSIPFATIGWKQTITNGTKNDTFFCQWLCWPKHHLLLLLLHPLLLGDGNKLGDDVQHHHLPPRRVDALTMLDFDRWTKKQRYLCHSSFLFKTVEQICSLSVIGQWFNPA